MQIGKLLNSVTQQQSTITTKPQIFSQQEIDSTAYFFMRLRNCYGSKFQQCWPDEKSLAMAKREYTQSIGVYSREKLGKLFIDLHLVRQANSDYDWPDVDKILGLMASGWETQAHKPYQHLALPDLGGQERARKAGQETLAQLRGLFV